MRRVCIVAFVGLLVALASFVAFAPEVAAPPVANPSIAIVYPFNNSTVSTLGTLLQIQVTNFTLTPEVGACKPGLGRYQVYMNDTLAGDFSEKNVTLTNLSTSLVKLGVQLVCANGAPLVPAVWSNVTVHAANPSIRLSAPASIRIGEGLVLTWTVAGFVLDSAAFKGPPVPGRGHVHVFEIVNGAENYIDATAATTYVVTGLKAGTHTFKVELDRKSTRLNSSHIQKSRMPSSA